MKKTIKNRKGFTLVEMLLSLAIICMIGGVIGGVCVSISNSFVTTYNIDDSADYALLYAKGFENSFLDCTQGSGAKNKEWAWYIDNPKGVSGAPLLKVSKPSGTPGAGVSNVFTPKFIGNSSTPSKWSVIMFFNVEEKASTGSEDGIYNAVLVNYRIYIKDNYARTDYIYRYDGSLWVPRFYERAALAGADAANRKVYVDTGSAGMTEATMTEFCKDPQGVVNTKAFNSIKADLEGTSTHPTVTYYAKLKYKWG